MLKRFSTSLEEDLLERFDRHIVARGYTNRSEALRDLIRDRLIQEEWSDGDREAAGAVVLVYDHHKHELSQKLAELQHQEYHSILSTLHVHLDHDNCLEVILLKGKARDIRTVADQLIAARGVKHGQFVSTTAGAGLA